MASEGHERVTLVLVPQIQKHPSHPRPSNRMQFALFEQKEFSNPEEL